MGAGSRFQSPLRATSRASLWRWCEVRPMKHFSLIYMTAAVLLATPHAPATPNYDGAWSLNFWTRQGACQPNSNFSANGSNGLGSHPKLVKVRGKVTTNGV